MLSTFKTNWKFFNYKKLEASEKSTLELLISYGERKPNFSCTNHIHIYEAYLFGLDYLKPESMPKDTIDWFEDIPVIYKGEGDIRDWVVSYRKNKVNYIETNIDIIASSFFMITRYEEVVNPAEDKYQRFPVEASLAYRQDFLHIPVVNLYIELLYKWFLSIIPGIKRKILWNGMDFAACITHDIDELRKYNVRPPVRLINSKIREGKWKESFSIIFDYLKAKFKGDPYDSFDYLMELSERNKYGSTYYFMSGGNTKHDNHYSILEPGVVNLIRKIRDRDYEIGLHSSFNASIDNIMISREKEDLEEVLKKKVFGIRQHYLRCKIPQSWSVQEKAGFLYDTSMYFSEYEGFRCGICYPFQPFDILKNRTIKIWELPLTIMEYSLFICQELSSDEVLQKIKDLINSVMKYNGVFVLLWHNSSFNIEKYPEGREVYENTINYLMKQNAFRGSARDIVNKWVMMIES